MRLAEERQRAAWAEDQAQAARDLPGRRRALATANADRDAQARTVAELASAGSDDKDKDVEARRRRAAVDLRAADKAIAKLEAEIARIEERATSAFSFEVPPNPPRPAQARGRFAPGTTPEAGAPVPTEALPSVGALRRHQGARLLAIATWEELDAGEREAERLGAKLVAGGAA